MNKSSLLPFLLVYTNTFCPPSPLPIRWFPYPSTYYPSSPELWGPQGAAFWSLNVGAATPLVELGREPLKELRSLHFAFWRFSHAFPHLLPQNGNKNVKELQLSTPWRLKFIHFLYLYLYFPSYCTIIFRKCQENRAQKFFQAKTWQKRGAAARKS